MVPTRDDAPQHPAPVATQTAVLALLPAADPVVGQHRERRA